MSCFNKKLWLKKRRSEVDDKTLIRALQTTSNIRQALIKVGLTGKGKNYDRCYNLIYKYNITQLGDEKTKSIKKDVKNAVVRSLRLNLIFVRIAFMNLEEYVNGLQKKN